MATTSLKTHSFNVMLDDHELSMLDALAKIDGVAKSVVVRQNIRARFAMREQNTPACATSAACLCPQLHIRPHV